MNSYNFALNSNPLFLILIIIGCLALSIYAYRRTIPQISPLPKRILISLRWIALSILCLLLFEPILEINSVKEIKPKTLVFFDNSKSLDLELTDNNIKEKYFNAIQSSAIKNLPNASFYKFDRESTKLDPDSLSRISLAGELTNLEETLERTERARGNDNIASVVIFSDGNFNDGRNPTYPAANLGLPIYTVTVGDTSDFADLSIQSIITNKIAYIDNAVPVNVNIQAQNYKADSVDVTLLEDGKVLDTKKLNINKQKNNYLTVFEYIPTEAGAKKLQVKIAELPRELSTENNYKSEFIKVLDNKKKLALFAGAPSYDVSILARILSKDPNAELNKFIQKKNESFYRQPTEADLKETGLFFFVGFPNSSTPTPLLNKLAEEIKKGKPFFFLFSQDTDIKKLNYLADILPFDIISSGKKEFEVLPVVEEKDLANPILRISGAENDIDKWNELSPLFKTETFLKLKAGAKSIMKIAVNNTVLNEPLLVQSNLNSVKSIVMTGYGLHRWKIASLSDKMMKDDDATDLTSILIDNSVKWLSVKNEGRKFTIEANKDYYTSGESIILNAQVYNDSYEPLENAEVIANIISDSDEREVILSSIGKGRYTARIQGLQPGDFFVKGEANYKSTIIGTDQDAFQLGDLNVEYLKLEANQDIMKELAEATGGNNYYYDNISNLQDDIISHKNFKAKEILNTEVINFWNKSWLLILAVTLFSIEWFYRKRLGMI